MAPVAPVTVRMFETLVGSANLSGGWGYEKNKASRLEPTCWGLLASESSAIKYDLAAHHSFLEKCVRSSGFLVEDPRWPSNVAFNAQVAFTWLNHPGLSSEEKIRTLLGWLVTVKGVPAPQSTSYRQDNSLQGWAWLDATFSWVEPTAWGILALYKGIQAGLVPEPAARGRIAEAERLLIDRCCRDGGWNFGNANVMGQELFPHVPTTALALLALQRRQEDPAVVRSLAFLEAHWPNELSQLSLGLSLICLRTYGRPIDAVTSRLRDLETRRLENEAKTGDARQPRNVHALAVALTGLTLQDHEAVFRF